MSAWTDLDLIRRAWREAASRDRAELAADARLLADEEDDELIRMLAATEGDPREARVRAAAALLLERRWSAATAGWA
jgi:hypothetical protein